MAGEEDPAFCACTATSRVLRASRRRIVHGKTTLVHLYGPQTWVTYNDQLHCVVNV